MFQQSLHEIFDEEERDELWAPDVEKVLRAAVEPYQQTLLPYASETTIECRTNVCEVSMLVPLAKQSEALHLIQGIPLGDRRGPSEAEDPASPDHVRISLSATFAAGRAAPSEVQEDLQQELQRRFPDGYESVRAYIDEHPEVLELDGPKDKPQ